MFTTGGGGNAYRNQRTSGVTYGVSCVSLGHNHASSSTARGLEKQDDQSSCFDREQTYYGNRLLVLRAELNEKELQLVELREQHISVVNRAAIARKNWEDAVKSKDRVILQLQKALHVKKCELDRQERVNEENVQRLLQQREEEEASVSVSSLLACN